MRDKCGRLYDPSTDTVSVLYPCGFPAVWDIVPRDGLHRYACGVHIGRTLSDVTTRSYTDLSVKNLRV